MSLNYGQKVCFDAAMGGENLFISGPGGTGKSFVLEAITEEFRARKIRFSVAASTGVAALNVGGVTIHSFLGTGIKGSVDSVKLLLGTKAFNYAVERLLYLDCLIIDEISMLSGDYLEMVNFWMQQTRSEYKEPFGGCQVILCGDFLQLPPVEKGKAPQWKFAFQAPCWERADFKCVDLHHSFRQEDQRFVNALNKVRFGQYTKEVRKVFRECIGRELEDPMYLVATNQEADSINLSKLRAFEGTEYKCKPTFEAHKAAIKRKPDWFNDLKNKILRDSLADSPLRLKVGVPVLMLKNTPGQFVNGSRGIVQKINLNKHGEIDTVDVKLDTGSVVGVLPAEWKRLDADGIPEITMRHFPMRLAWSSTIHKSQGLTLNNVQIDPSEIFAPGQVYVALSRLKSLEGMSLTDAIDPSVVKADPDLVSFYDKLIIEGKGEAL